MTPYRAELGIGAEPVVLYAGNVGFSQSLDLLLEAARRLPRRHRPDQRRRGGPPGARTAARPGWPTCASPATCPTTGSSSCWPPATSTPCRCAPGWRASACRRRRTRSSPPAARSSPPSTPAPRCRASSTASGAGVVVPPDDPDRFVDAVGALVADPERRRARWARRAGSGSLGAASPAAVAARLRGPRRAHAGPRRRAAGPTARPAGSISPSWFPHRRPRRPPGWPRRARARRSASRAGRCSRCSCWRSSSSASASSSTPAPPCRPPTPRRRPSTTTGTSPTASRCATATEFVQLDGALEEVDSNGQPINNDFLRTGVHSHDDGVIHWHPYTSARDGQAGHARRVPRQLRRRARRRLAEVPGEPERRQGVRRGRDEVPRRRGRRAVGHRVAEPAGHRATAAATSPGFDDIRIDHEQPGVHDRLPAARAPTSRCRRGPPTWRSSAPSTRARPSHRPSVAAEHRARGHRCRRAATVTGATTTTAPAATTSRTGHDRRPDRPPAADARRRARRRVRHPPAAARPTPCPSRCCRSPTCR